MQKLLEFVDSLPRYLTLDQAVTLRAMVNEVLEENAHLKAQMELVDDATVVTPTPPDLSKVQP